MTKKVIPTLLVVLGLVFVVVALLVVGLIFGFVGGSVARVSPKMIQLAEGVTRYPNSTNWELKKVEPRCGLGAIDGCPVALEIVKFKSNDDWSVISKFYVQELKKIDWEGLPFAETAYSGTVSTIALQFDKDGCTGDLSNSYDRRDLKTIKGIYEFSIEC